MRMIRNYLNSYLVKNIFTLLEYKLYYNTLNTLYTLMINLYSCEFDKVVNKKFNPC